MLPRSCALVLALFLLTACACTTVVSVGMPNDAGPLPLDDASPLPIVDDAASNPDAAIPLARPTPEISLEEPEWGLDPGVTTASVAWNGEMYLVAFATSSGGQDQIRAARYDAEGNLLDPRGFFVGTGTSPRVVTLPDGNFLCAWQSPLPEAPPSRPVANPVVYTVITREGEQGIVSHFDGFDTNWDIIAFDVAVFDSNVWVAYSDRGFYAITPYPYLTADRKLDSPPLYSERSFAAGGHSGQIRIAFPDGRPAGYAAVRRDGHVYLVEWRRSMNGRWEPELLRELVTIDGEIEDVVTGTSATLITWRAWRADDGVRALHALRIHSDTGEPVDPTPIVLDAFNDLLRWKSPIDCQFRPAPVAFIRPNGFAIVQGGVSGRSVSGTCVVPELPDEIDGEIVFLNEMGGPPVGTPFGATTSVDVRMFAGATANGEALIVGTECNPTCVLKPVLWSFSEERAESLAAPRGTVYVTGPRDVQVACAREICLAAWNHRTQQTIFTRAFDRTTGQVVNEIQAVPYVHVHGGFRLLSDGEDFLLINTVTNFWPRGREVQVMARRTNGDFEWSEPTYASPEIVNSNYVSPMNSVFDGSRYVMLFPAENAIREIAFSRDGSFLGTRTVIEDSNVVSTASNGVDGYVIYSSSSVSMIDHDGNAHSESITIAPGFATTTAMPSGRYAFATRNDFDEFTMWTHGSGADFVRGSVLTDFTDNWRTLTDLRMFADEDGFVAVFRPAFRGPPLTPADRFVVRRIDRMGALVGDEMPLDGMTQIEAVASAGRSEMAVVYRTDLDPVAPGNQLSELRARIVTVPRVPID